MKLRGVSKEQMNKLKLIFYKKVPSLQTRSFYGFKHIHQHLKKSIDLDKILNLLKELFILETSIQSINQQYEMQIIT